ncbi:MAG: glycoside hydrolase family 88 protein [Roseivivax sp.]|nr:glycoside hydrolase family 88 protein [Roseivivax sp.]
MPETAAVLAYFDTLATGYAPYKGGAWCYEDGLLYGGLAALHRATGQGHWLDHLRARVAAQIGVDGALAGYQITEFNIDNLLSGRALLYLAEATGEARYLDVARGLARQFDWHPRTRSGVFWHKLRYPWQIWLDGLYMAHPFRIGLAQLDGDEAAIDDSLAQIAAALTATRDPVSGLYRHAYDEARLQPWCDPSSGLSASLWSRALGWLAMALVDVAALVGPERFAPLSGATTELLSRIAAARGPDGRWYQVFDMPDLPGNYLEGSASAMFAYAQQRGRDLGLHMGEADWVGDLLTVVLQPGADGALHMVDVCEVAGLGWFDTVFRDGSPAYYLTERRVSDEIKGVGPLMMATAARIAAQP